MPKHEKTRYEQLEERTGSFIPSAKYQSGSYPSYGFTQFLDRNFPPTEIESGDFNPVYDELDQGYYFDESSTLEPIADDARDYARASEDEFCQS